MTRKDFPHGNAVLYIVNVSETRQTTSLIRPSLYVHTHDNTLSSSLVRMTDVQYHALGDELLHCSRTARREPDHLPLITDHDERELQIRSSYKHVKQLGKDTARHRKRIPATSIKRSTAFHCFESRVPDRASYGLDNSNCQCEPTHDSARGHLRKTGTNVYMDNLDI